jgi:hypothetical protein
MEKFSSGMPFYGMVRSVALIRTAVSEECIASIIRVPGIDELGTTLAATEARYEKKSCFSIFMNCGYICIYSVSEFEGNSALLT